MLFCGFLNANQQFDIFVFHYQYPVKLFLVFVVFRRNFANNFSIFQNFCQTKHCPCGIIRTCRLIICFVYRKVFDIDITPQGFVRDSLSRMLCYPFSIKILYYLSLTSQFFAAYFMTMGPKFLPPPPVPFSHASMEM